MAIFEIRLEQFLFLPSDGDFKSPIVFFSIVNIHFMAPLSLYVMFSVIRIIKYL